MIFVCTQLKKWRDYHIYYLNNRAGVHICLHTFVLAKASTLLCDVHICDIFIRSLIPK
jgi:hypothetical protein